MLRNSIPMNRRYIIVASIILGILLLTIWRGCQKSPEKVLPAKRSADVAPRHFDPKRIKEPETKEEYAAVVKEKCIAFAKANNAPIAFYGRVVDQDSQPLQGVAVEYYVTAIPLIPVLWGPDETTNGSCITDQNGLFSVEGKRGVSLGVSSLTKAGYRESGYYEQGHARYEPYGSQKHIPNRDKAVEFMLIRDDLPKAEKVLDKHIRFAWNKEPLTLSLGPNLGNLILTAKREGYNPTNLNNPFDWSADMSFDALGLVPLSAGSMTIAPDEGYTPKHLYDFPKNRDKWAYRVNGSRFAILTNDHHFGMIEIDLYADGDEVSSCWIKIYLNKSGSRNIDYK